MLCSHGEKKSWTISSFEVERPAMIVVELLLAEGQNSFNIYVDGS